MLAEFVKQLEATSKKANGVEIVTSPQVPDEVGVRQGDQLVWKAVPPPRRLHEVNGLADLVAACEDKDMAPLPEVYYDRAAIVALLDRNDRRSKVTLNLRESERFTVLRTLRTATHLDVRSAIKLLRFDLHSTGVGTVISALRRVDFTRKGDSSASAQHGKETLGRSVELAVQNAEGVPEDFLVETPIYTNRGLLSFVARVRVGIYLDVQAEKITVQTMADEIEAAYGIVQASIGETLAKALPTVPIFNGKP